LASIGKFVFQYEKKGAFASLFQLDFLFGLFSNINNKKEKFSSSFGFI